VHKFLAKLARFAVSKGAAFCYAVTVGVSGQLAYNYLQPKDPVPTIVTLPAGAAVAPAPVKPPAPAPLSPVAPQAEKPPPARPVATAPILPPPPEIALPPAALAAPPLRPAVLPSSEPPASAAPGEAAVNQVSPPAPEQAANPEPSPARQSLALPLSPIEKIIDVSPPPAAGLADPDGPIPLLPPPAAVKASETEKAAAPARPRKRRPVLTLVLRAGLLGTCKPPINSFPNGY